jgi:hypothetical protein
MPSLSKPVEFLNNKYLIAVVVGLFLYGVVRRFI